MRLQPLTITVIVLGTCLAAFQPATGAEGASRGSPRRANAKKSSPSILLPEAGIYPAKKFFPLVKKLAGRAVKPTSKKISAKPVTISIEMAGQLAHFDELALLLAAHGVYLHHHVTRGREIYVASGTRFWKPRHTPMYTRTFTVTPRRFTAAVREVEQFLEQLNHGKNRRLPNSVVLPVEATGRLIVRSPSESTLEEVEALVKLVESQRKWDDSTKTRLFAFRPSNFPGSLLRKRLRGFLDESDWQQLHIVVPRGPNALWIRTTPTLWTKVHRILALADTPGVDWPGEPKAKKLAPGSGSPRSTKKAP